MTGEQSDDTGQTSLDKFLSKFTSKDDKIIPIPKIENHTDLPIKTIDMPSKKIAPVENTNTRGQKFHKLDTNYPNPLFQVKMVEWYCTIPICMTSLVFPPCLIGSPMEMLQLLS